VRLFRDILLNRSSAHLTFWLTLALTWVDEIHAHGFLGSVWAST